jgi:LysM repeat protein
MTTSPDNRRQFSLQNLLMGIGAAIVVFLTILIAIFLANVDLGEQPAEVPSTPTPQEGVQTSQPIPQTATATSVLGNTPTQPPLQATATATQMAPPTATATPSPSPTLHPTASPTPRTPTATPCIPRTDWPIYIVQPGDTLFSIAARTGTTVDQLRRANCLPNNNIYAGQNLRVPQLPATPTPTPTASNTPTATPVTPTPTFTLTPTVDTPTPTATPPDVTLGTPTPTLTATIPVEIPPDTPTPPGDVTATATLPAATSP